MLRILFPPHKKTVHDKTFHFVMDGTFPACGILSSHSGCINACISSRGATMLRSFL